MVRAMSDAHLAPSSSSDKVDSHRNSRSSLFPRQTASENDDSSGADELSPDSGDKKPAASIEANCWENHNESIARLLEEVGKYRRSLVWTRVFSTSDDLMTKKKNGIKKMVSGTAKFVKNTTRGVYLASIIYKNGKILCTNDDGIPTLCVDDAVTTISGEHHHWLIKMSWCWEYISGLIDSNSNNNDNSECLTFRSKLMNAVSAMRSLLNLSNIGQLHYIPVIHDETAFLVTVRFFDLDDRIQGVNLKWLPIQKVLRKKLTSPAQSALVRQILNITSFARNSKITLKRGLYVCYMKLCCSLNSIHVAVKNSLPSFLPYAFVRDDPIVTGEEWQYIQEMDVDPSFTPSSNQIEFQTAVSTAIHTLFRDLDIDSDIVPGHRLYRAEILKPNDTISIILILPRPDDVCSAPSGLSQMVQPLLHRACDTLPIAAFEIIHQSAYQPDFFITYCRLAIFLEHYFMITQYLQRRSLLENDIRVYKTLYEGICGFQKKLDEIWNKSRWISRIASEARERRIKFGYDSSESSQRMALALSKFLTPVAQPVYEGFLGEDVYDKDENFSSKLQKGSLKCSEKQDEQDSADLNCLYERGTREHDNIRENSPNGWSYQEDQPCTNEMISVYTAYDCESHNATPIHLSIQQNTTSTEVVKLVLEEVSKNSPSSRDVTKAANESSNFCLVVVVGTRERRLKDDFALCRIQSPWNKGRLYVRRRSALLAAVRYGNEALV